MDTEITDQPRFWTPTFTYEHRPDGTILMRQTGELEPHSEILASYLEHWAETAPDRTWIARRVDGGDWRRISYAEALRAAQSIGSALLGMDLGQDRPLLILSENSLEHALLALAATYVGVPHAPVATAYSLVSRDHAKLRDIADLLKPGAVFADDGAAFASALDAIAADDRTVINHRNPVAGALRFDDLLETDPQAGKTARVALTPDTVVKFLFTSGSTGSPKAVINTNRMICSSQAMVRDCYRFLTWQPPVLLDWAPWNHTAAGNKVMYMVLTNGGTYYIDDGRPAPGKFDETLRNLREISCSWYFNLPVGFDMIADALVDDDDLAQTFYADLGMIFYAGAGMAQRTWDRLSQVGRRITGRDILLATGLGTTETAPFALACTEIQDRAGNVGVPSRGLTLKLAPADDRFEARLKGPSIMPGYYRDPEKTAEAFDDEGFYCLGDALRPADPEDFSRGFYFDGRLAENFKLTTGTWVAVGVVRAGLVDAMQGLIRDAVIVGENEAELGALLWLSESASRMPATDREKLLRDRLEVAARNASGSSNRVRRALVLTDAPTFDRGEATEKGSLNQRALRVNRAGQITELYADAPGVIRV